MFCIQTGNQPIDLTVNILIFIIGTAILVKGSDLFIDYAAEIARSWGVSELSVLAAGLYLVRKTLGLRIDGHSFLRSLAFGLCYVLPVWTAWLLIPDIWWRLGVTTVLIVPIFLLVNVKLNPSTLLDEMKGAMRRFIR